MTLMTSYIMIRQSYKILFSFIFLFILISGIAAQQVTVSGSASGAEGKTLKFVTWADMITFTEELVAQTTIDSLGKFSVSFELPSTSYIALAIDLHRAGLYMQPGMVYQIKIAQINNKDNLEVNPFILSEDMEIKLVNPGENGLNFRINTYNDKYNQFLLDHFNALYHERKKSYLDTFQLQVNEIFSGIDLSYFQNYMRYKTAGLEQLAHAKSQFNLASSYFIDQPILYKNVEYMQFFNNYFTKYLTVTSNILRKIDLISIIKEPDPYPVLMKKLAADSVLKNESLRELVLLKGLFELFYSKPELQENIIGSLATIRQESPFENNRVVAEDMYDKVTKLRPGTKAPEFYLQGRETEGWKSLEDLKGKPVVMNFWTTFCEECLAEMELQVPLYEKYKDEVEFVSICINRYWIQMNYFARVKTEFAWWLLHYSDNTDLLIDYEVKTYPLYLIIDKHGDTYQFPAPPPSEGLERVIESIIH